MRPIVTCLNTNHRGVHEQHRDCYAWKPATQEAAKPLDAHVDITDAPAPGLREADKMLNELGMRLLDAGDKEGWSTCDEVGHIIRNASQPQDEREAQLRARIDEAQEIEGWLDETNSGQQFAMRLDAHIHQLNHELAEPATQEAAKPLDAHVDITDGQEFDNACQLIVYIDGMQTEQASKVIERAFAAHAKAAPAPGLREAAERVVGEAMDIPGTGFSQSVSRTAIGRLRAALKGASL